MNIRKNDHDAQLDRIVAQIRDEAVDPAVVRSAGDRVWRRLAAETAGEPLEQRSTDPESQTIRGCADVHALLPAYVAGSLTDGKALLVGDHTRECVTCRRSLLELRSGTPGGGRTLASRGSRSFPVLRWAAAAAVMAGAVLAGAVAYQYLPVDPARSAVHVRSVDGALYRITGNWSSAVGVGEEIAGGQVFRTAKGSRAVVRLADGSDVEMNERSELSISARRAGATLNLSRGSIIVQASDQGSKHLYVATSDCRVAVTGTIFSVNHGTKGSRVSVIEGEVHVERSGARDVLHPGDQVSTNDSLGRVPLSSEIAWSRDANSHLALLAELTELRREIAQLPHPATRHETRLLDLAPEGTVVYVAIPNVGTTLAEAHRIFRDRIEHSPVLQDWWRQTMAPGGADGELDEAIEWVRAFSEQLEDEIVVTFSASPDGRFDGMLALAELTHPDSFSSFLAGELARIPATEEHPAVRVVSDPAIELPTAGHDLLVFTRGNLLAVSPSLAELRRLQSALDRGAAGVFATSAFRASLARSYEEGTTFLVGVDLEKILSSAAAKGAPSADTLRAAGLLDVRHLVVEGKELDGTGTWRAALSFDRSRRGIASWLAAPAPMGTLDFISPDATLAAAFVTKDPVAMASDLIDLVRNAHPECGDRLAAFESEHGVNVLRDLAAPLGGEFAFALDGPVLPTPAWKAIFEVYDATGLQSAIEWVVGEANRSVATNEPLGLRIDHEDVGGRTWYAIRSARLPVEVHYAFVDGYLVAAPSRGLVEAAIATRTSGASLPESPRFTALLPRDGEANFSVVAYQNLSALTSTPSPEANDALRRVLGDAPASLAYAYGEPDRIVAAGMRPNGLFGPELGMLFGLDSLADAQQAARQLAEGQATPEAPAKP